MSDSIPDRKTGRSAPMPLDDAEIEELYHRLPYFEAYSRHTDLRVARDPQGAVGGQWDVLGAAQLNFLRGQGMEPRHRLFDLGCGTLRAGRHFIRFLDPGNYHGFDLSPAAISYAQELIRAEGLEARKPVLAVNRAQDLRFAGFTSQTFDYLLAFSVFTHLQPEHIAECFEHIGQIMHADSAFFFTFRAAGRFEQRGPKDFSQPFSWFVSLAKRYDFELRDHSPDFRHPRAQRMISIKRR